jgi:AsmA family protein
MSPRRAARWALWTGFPLLLIVVVIVLWNWDWLIPVVEARASAELGRPVTMAHLQVRLGRVTRVVADDVTIGNPPHWSGPPLAAIKQLVLQVTLWDYIFHRQLIVPLIALHDPQVDVMQESNGTANYKLNLLSSGKVNGANIGVVDIDNGHVHAVLARLKANFDLDVATRDADSKPRIVATAHGTYNSAPIIGHMIGGAVLSLRSRKEPWPIDLEIANGTTHVSLVGTLQQPLRLQGANLKLQFAGQDISNLTPLTGIPLAQSPPYRLSGQLDFKDGHVQFRDFYGHIGRSDLEGTIDVDPGPLPLVDATLRSHQVDLPDLGGFIGAQPGRVSTPGQTPETRAKVAAARASSGLLPTKPISLPELRFANVRLRYHGEHILGESIPLDHVSVVLDVTNGAVHLHPISFGVGTGSINGDIALTSASNNLMHAKANIHFDRVDVARLMAATHMFGGAGTISGTATINSVGGSMATFLSNGNGGIELGMVGGNLSALLVDLSGLEFGNALLSALGLPRRTPVNCLVDDMPLQRGVITVDPLIVDTGEAIVRGSGSITLKDERMDLQLRTAPKHLSIGSLPAPIDIGGTFKHPSIRPGAELAVRGGIAAALGAIFPPLVALPMIQLGVRDSHACEQILAEIEQQPGGRSLPPPRPIPPTRGTSHIPGTSSSRVH